MTGGATATRDRAISNHPSELEESEITVGGPLDESRSFLLHRAHYHSFIVANAGPDIAASHPGFPAEGGVPPTAGYVIMNAGMATPPEGPMPLLVSKSMGSAVGASPAADVWYTGTINFPRGNQDVLIHVLRRLGPYGALAREFGIRAGFLESLGRAIGRYVRQHPHLTFSVERLVDPEVRRAVQVCFEVNGTRSSEETTQVWNELEAVLDGVADSQVDRDALIEKIGVHVHRGSA